MNWFDILALWTGRILLISMVWGIIFGIWYLTIYSIWNIHSNFMITRKFCLHEKPKEFIEYVRSGKYKK